VPDLAQQQSKVSLPIKNIVDYAIKKECGGYAAARNGSISFFVCGSIFF